MLFKNNWTIILAFIGAYTPVVACLSDPDTPIIIDDSPERMAYPDEIQEIVKDWRKSLKLHHVDEDSSEGIEMQDEDTDAGSTENFGDIEKGEARHVFPYWKRDSEHIKDDIVHF